VAGAASYTASRQLLLGAYFLIGSLAFIVVLRIGKQDEDILFMFVIGSLSLSLLMSAVLISDNLLGYDIHNEFYFFLRVLRSGKWETQFTNLYNSVTSITILPSVIALVSGLDGVSVLRFVFPAVYSVVPVFLYKLYREIASPRSAYLSVFLFMSFYYDNRISLARMEVAEVLLVVLLLVSFLPRMRRVHSSTFAAMILTVGLVAAHYTMAYLYTSFVIFASVVAAIFRRRVLALYGSIMLLLTVVTLLAWYAYVAGGAGVAALSRDFSMIFNGIIEDFFAPDTRPQVAVQALSFQGMPGILHDVNRATLYLVQLCLIIGFLAFLLKREKSEAERKMLPLMVVAFIFICSAVTLPFFAATLQLGRIYHIALLFASPCFLYGVGVLDSSLGLVGSFLSKVLHMRLCIRFSARSALAAGILFSCFLFTSGWAWAVSMDVPTSLVLDSERFLVSSDVRLNAVYFMDYTVPEDIAGARWLLTYHSSPRPICADIIARWHVLNSYGEFPREGPTLPRCYGYSNPYVFISEFNNLRGVGQASAKPPSYDRFPMSEISAKLSIKNRVFSDGGAVIYE
jgi:uncharacterized membrane protein